MATQAANPSYFDPQTLARLTGLELRARHVVEGYLSGMHRSPYHGFSVEFAQHREYSPGDDLRYVDWKVFGRSDKVYLKQFEEETNLPTYLVLDASESMGYQGPDSALSKLEYAKCALASLAWLILSQRDSAAVAVFDDHVRRQTRPSSSPAAWEEMLRALEDATAQGKSGTGPVLHELAERCPRRGLAVVFTDLFDDVAALLSGLQHFRFRGHDVIVFHVLDAAEIDFPFDQPTRFRGLESLPDIVADPPALRQAYKREFERFSRQVQVGLRDRQVDYVLLRTDRPLDLALSSYLATRRRRG